MKKIKSKVDKIIALFPFLVSMFFTIINFIFKIIQSNIPGLEKILESIITFTSIIIGILIALFGVIVTISESDVMNKLQKNRNDKTIFKYCLETLFTNFFVLIFSIVMQSLISFTYKINFIDIYFNIWLFFVIYSLLSSIRSIYYLLLISFYQKDKSIRPASSMQISDEKREKIRKNNN